MKTGCGCLGLIVALIMAGEIWGPAGFFLVLGMAVLIMDTKE